MHFLWSWHGKRWNKSSSISRWSAEELTCMYLSKSAVHMEGNTLSSVSSGRESITHQYQSAEKCCRCERINTPFIFCPVSGISARVICCFFFLSDHEELCNFTATARQLWHVSNSVPLVGWNITSTPACNPLWFWGWILGQRAELNVKMIDTRDFLADITCCWNSFTSKRN